ncbi:MAG: UDP-galactopyranose mutase [Gammaproteobacteria bacterium]|nr:UDP-galactopyranose mutase [Gammaproteobacteria bacterium]
MNQSIDFKNKEVLVLGGGISGLSTAWLLNHLGAKPTIIEKEEDYGGIGRTHYLDGQKYEFGPHILHAEHDHTIRFYEKYGAREIEYYTRMAFGDSFEKLIDFPYSVDSIFQLPLELGREVIKELFEERNGEIDQTNLETYLRSIVGNTLYENFNDGYSRKFWGKEPKDIPANGAASWISLRTDDKRLFQSWQAYPNGDFNKFMEWVRGETPIIKQEVLGVKRAKSKIDAVITNGPELSADIYISTIPLKSIFPEIRRDLSYAGNVLVAMKLEEGPVFPHGVGGIYNPGEKFAFKRVCEYPSMTEENYPELKNGTLIGFEYNTFPWKESLPQEFYIQDSLRASKELLGVEPQSYRLHSHPHIYPIRDKKEMKMYSNITKEVSKYDNFFLNGRYGNFRYTNMNDCFEMSFDLIRDLSGLTTDELIRETGL